MGQVFRAYDATLRRRVAIKVLRPDKRDPDASGTGHPHVGAWSADRVLREARMAAALEHPNVINVYDVGEQDGVLFIVMELVKGQSLRASVGNAQVPVLDRVRWLVDVARALGAAHKVGLVHRDVKPENVLVREDGVVKVLDFGIARLARTPSLRPPGSGDERPPPSDRLSQATASEMAATLERSTFAGTPAYMAPELIRGDGGDTRADQFAWGVVAYELLTGKVPWRTASGNVSLLLSVLEGTPAPLSAEALGVPPAFVDAVMRALSKNKDERFASMEDLVVATGLAPPPGESRPSMPGGPSPDASGRIELPPDLASAPTLLATASAASLSAAAAGAFARSRTKRRWATLGIVGVVVVGGGLAIAAMVRSSAGTAPGAPAPTTTGSARAPLAFLPREPRRLTFEQGCEEYPSLTPDGATVVFDTSVGDDVHVVAMDIATGVQRRLTTQPGWHFSPAVSPDGKLVAYVRQHEDELGTWLVPLDGSAPARRLVVGRTRPTWTPDGRALWAGAAEKPAADRSGDRPAHPHAGPAAGLPLAEGDGAARRARHRARVREGDAARSRSGPVRAERGTAVDVRRGRHGRCHGHCPRRPAGAGTEAPGHPACRAVAVPARRFLRLARPRQRCAADQGHGVREGRLARRLVDVLDGAGSRGAAGCGRQRAPGRGAPRAKNGVDRRGARRRARLVDPPGRRLRPPVAPAAVGARRLGRRSAATTARGRSSR